MKVLATLFIATTLLLQTSCTLLDVQGGAIPSMDRINAWIANDEYGRALSSLEHIPADTPHFSAYINKRKEVISLASLYEQRILMELEKITDKEDSASKLSILDRALEKHPNSEILREQHKTLLREHLLRVRRLDAEALLVRAQQLYNKLPLHEQDARESPINFSAHFKLQSMRGEISDMHNRLMAMAGLLVEDNDLSLANRCLSQARLFPADQASLTKLNILQKQINDGLLVLEKEQHDRLKHASEKNIERMTKEKKALARKLQDEISTAIKDQRLIDAGKLLNELGRISPDNPNYLKLKIEHREKVSVIVKKKITLGNALYRQEKILQAKEVWEEALILDPDNKTLQTSILRADHVLDKLKNLRLQQNTGEN